MACQQDQMKSGKPYPRTCEDCGLGPCKKYPKAKVERRAPIPMILRCPKCGTQHIDQPQPARWIKVSWQGKVYATMSEEEFDRRFGGNEMEAVSVGGWQHKKAWDNPPHKTHECQYCGCLWRPANVPTVGVFQLPEE